MPSYRLLHANYRTGRRSKQLTRLEKDVWLAYMLSADDFGVCPASARKLQADDPWLAQERTAAVVRCFDVLIRVELVRAFEDGGDRYLYQPDWQDYQRILHPTKTSRPAIPAAHLEQCLPTTILLVLAHHPKREAYVSGWFPGFIPTFLEKFPKLSNKVSEKFSELSHEISELFLLHAHACDANANANAVLDQDLQTQEQTPSDVGKPHPVKALWTEHERLFVAKYGQKPAYDRGKDASALKRLLDKHGFAHAKALIEAFFDSRDPWVAACGHGLGPLASATVQNKLIAELSGRGPRNDGRDWARDFVTNG